MDFHVPRKYLYEVFGAKWKSECELNAGAPLGRSPKAKASIKYFLLDQGTGSPGYGETGKRSTWAGMYGSKGARSDLIPWALLPLSAVPKFQSVWKFIRTVADSLHRQLTPFLMLIPAATEWVCNCLVTIALDTNRIYRFHKTDPTFVWVGTSFDFHQLHRMIYTFRSATMVPISENRQIGPLQ